MGLDKPAGQTVKKGGGEYEYEIDIDNKNKLAAAAAAVPNAMNQDSGYR